MESELRHFGIRVVVIEPGYIDTPILVKESSYGADSAPYDELARIWDEAGGKLRGESIPGPELVAGAIGDALEDDAAKLRHPVGADAEMIVGLRDSMGYEEFVGTVREFLGIDW